MKLIIKLGTKFVFLPRKICSIQYVGETIASVFLKMNLYVIIMSHTSFRVNPHSIVCLNVKELLARNR